MKTILVDAIHTFIIKGQGTFKEMHELLEQYPNKKIILTNASPDEHGLKKVPYEVFTLNRNPVKTNPEYFKRMLKHFNLSADDVIFFEHSEKVIESARSIGINTYFYDQDQKDLAALKNFIDQNI